MEGEMMREFKLREWETNRKTMSYGKKSDFDDSISFRFEHTEGGKRILMQYTGLKDIDGDEIYEGDILEYGYEVYRNPVPVRVIGQVKFDLGCFLFSSNNKNIPLRDLYCERLKIIGNIYENPELLN